MDKNLAKSDWKRIRGTALAQMIKGIGSFPPLAFTCKYGKIFLTGASGKGGSKNGLAIP